ncbi:MAG: GxxExxY protein [Planctomycetes bacterium]|nr:GxxExxY protein [Planctomycetota bacterium]
MASKQFSDEFKSRCDEIWEVIKQAAYTVANTLGVGFLEKVYENALAIELRKRGMKVIQQHPLKVFHDAQVVGEFVVDLLVEDCVLVELKVAKALDNIHEAIALNYIKASPFWLIGLINYGKPRIDAKRYIDG